jgi:hypothetical protein
MAEPTPVFIRDDDVGALTPEFQSFFHLFYDRDLPVSYQIIPERLTADCAEFLVKARELRPDLVEFGQHGLRHEMRVRGKLEFYEFGPERSYDEQFADIAHGRRLLRNRLGEAPVEVFTPPRHRYDRNTLRALAEQGFSIFSASSYLKLHHRLAYGVAQAFRLSSIGARGVPYHGRRRPDCGLHELSIGIAADNGASPSGSPQAVVQAVAQARRQQAAVGIMFHHQVYRGAPGEARLRDIVSGLCNMTGVRFQTMSGVIGAGSTA